MSLTLLGADHLLVLASDCVESVCLRHALRAQDMAAGSMLEMILVVGVAACRCLAQTLGDRSRGGRRVMGAFVVSTS